MLQELIECVEKANGPDRKLDEAIFRSVQGRDRHVSTFEQYDPSEQLPNYTASFDAALSLMPEDFDWIVGNVNGMVGGTPYACVGTEKAHYAETPVLSLLLGILRARADLAARKAAVA